MQTTERAESRGTDGRALITWGTALFGAGALMIILFLEQVLPPLGWPLYLETSIAIGALLASVGHALLVAGLVLRRR